MTSRLLQDISPPRPPLSWSETWETHDQGLIKYREVGRELAIKRPDLVSRASCYGRCAVQTTG